MAKSYNQIKSEMNIYQDTNGFWHVAVKRTGETYYFCATEKIAICWLEDYASYKI